MSPTLPTELLHHIIDDIPYDATTLSRCCLVSKTFFSRSHSKLYGTWLVPVPPVESRTPKQVAKGEWTVFDSMVNRLAMMQWNPELLEMIKTLELSERPKRNKARSGIHMPPLDLITGNIPIGENAFVYVLSNVETLVLHEEPSGSVRLSNLKAVKVSPRHLNRHTWDLLDQRYQPNVRHVSLDFANLASWKVTRPGYVSPRLETFEMTSMRFPYSYFPRLLDNAIETLHHLRIPLPYIPSFELASFSNLTDLIVTDIHHGDIEMDATHKFFDLLPQLRNLKTLSLHDVQDLASNVHEAIQLASSLPPTVTRLNLPGATLRAIVLFSDPRTNGVKVFGCDLTPRLEDEEDCGDVTVLRAFCRMRGLTVVDIPDEAPPWCCATRVN